MQPVTRTPCFARNVQALLALFVLEACNDPARADVAASDASDVASIGDSGADDVAQLDVPPVDSGPPPRVVPANGWANAVTSSDIAQSISEPDDAGMTYVNLAANSAVIIGPPEGTQAGTVAIGETGRFVVVDMGVGEEVVDRAGNDLEVVEGPGIPEPYRVYVSVLPDGPFVQVGDGSAVSRFDLSGSGITSARYVKIESRRTADSILHGLGSPEYPGAEIDAVGALYPGGQE